MEFGEAQDRSGRGLSISVCEACLIGANHMDVTVLHLERHINIKPIEGRIECSVWDGIHWNKTKPYRTGAYL